MLAVIILGFFFAEAKWGFEAKVQPFNNDEKKLTKKKICISPLRLIYFLKDGGEKYEKNRNHKLL